MYNCANEASAYLQEKYGVSDNGLNLKDTKQKPNGDIVSRLTHDDLVIKTLLGQYYYGIDAKRELYFKLVGMKIMPDKENRC